MILFSGSQLVLLQDFGQVSDFTSAGNQTHTQKNKGLKLYLFWVQQLVPGAVPLKGHICTFFTPNRYIIVP